MRLSVLEQQQNRRKTIAEFLDTSRCSLPALCAGLGEGMGLSSRFLTCQSSVPRDKPGGAVAFGEKCPFFQPSL